jgi:hypothetical protein
MLAHPIADMSFWYSVRITDDAISGPSQIDFLFYFRVIITTLSWERTQASVNYLYELQTRSQSPAFSHSYSSTVTPIEVPDRDQFKSNT